MKLKIAFQIDSLSSLNFQRDTSLLLAFEAQQRGYEVCYFHPSQLSCHEGKIYARAGKFGLTKTAEGIIPDAGEQHRIDLSNMDVVMMRQNPPFDMTYICNTYLLDQITDQVLVLNNPSGVRNSVEKLLPLEFPELIPPTLISQDWQEVESFCHQHKEVIIKPLFDFGGHSVFHVKSDEGQLKSLYQLLCRSYPGLPFIVQPFLPDVITGDKRLVLIDGELIGGYKRVPIKGEVRSNQLMGGTVAACELSPRDLEICTAIGPRLRELGLFFVGIDIIGNYLIEINVTSPTGLVALNELNGIQSEKIFWDKVATKI